MSRDRIIAVIKAALQRAGTRIVPKLVHRWKLSVYDPEREMDLLPIIVPIGREAIDVGANIGAYSLALSRLVSHVYAFEPVPEVAALIARALPANVTVKELAASDCSGELNLFVPIHGGKQNTTLAQIAEPHVCQIGQKYRVRTITLDSLADHDVGFIKIDVEGHEMHVLCGANELIAKYRPTVLIEAEDRYHKGTIHDVFRFFAVREYKGFFVLVDELRGIDEFHPSMQSADLLKPDLPRRGSSYVNNFIFIPAERCGGDLIKAMQDTVRRNVVRTGDQSQ